MTTKNIDIFRTIGQFLWRIISLLYDIVFDKILVGFLKLTKILVVDIFHRQDENIYWENGRIVIIMVYIVLLATYPAVSIVLAIILVSGSELVKCRVYSISKVVIVLMTILALINVRYAVFSFVTLQEILDAMGAIETWPVIVFSFNPIRTITSLLSFNLLYRYGGYVSQKPGDRMIVEQESKEELQKFDAD